MDNELTFSNTCPTIDEELNYVEDSLESGIKYLINEIPNSDESKEELIKITVKSLYKEIKESFEKVRTTNEEMRDQANSQIKEIYDEFEDLN